MATVTANNISNDTSIGGALDSQTGAATKFQGMSAKTFVVSLATGLVVFAVEFILFILIKNKLTRIYQPRTYLVPERERTKPSPPGLFSWVAPVFRTSNSEFIQKCGLDAYFFLRFLRMLLKIFLPLALLILPILLPINKVEGRGSSVTPRNESAGGANVTGLDQFAWGNVAPNKTHRYWAHLILAIVVVTYACYVFYDELRGYIRLRQAYLTSPQHRLRASATTVLVSAIPRKWLSVEALDALYDVFPGGIRNIWINRNLDELNEKVKVRDDIAKALESAETNLIKKCKKKQLKRLKKEANKSGNKEMIKNEKAIAEVHGNQMARDAGVSSGDPHSVPHTVGEALHGDNSDTTLRAGAEEPERNRPFIPVPVIGEGLEAVGQGIGNLGNTVLGGLRKVRKDVDAKITTTGGFVVDDSALTTQKDDRIGDGVAPAYRLGTGGSNLRGPTSSGQTRPSAEDDDQGNFHPTLRSASNASTARPSGSQDDRTFQHHDYPGNHRTEIPGSQKSLPPPPNGQSDTSIARDTTSGATAPAWKFWKKNSLAGTSGVPPSARRDGSGDEHPLTEPSPITPTSRSINPERPQKGEEDKQKRSFKTHGKGKEGDEKEGQEYPIAINEEYDDDDYGTPKWQEYLKEKDRETMRLPIFGWKWMWPIPFVGEKVDTIYHCRKELARLNLEIEEDQQEPEKFPLMNSAFIQFNHQVAAHMACQSISHHVPKQMAPRVVEISPDDILWDNMSIRWWERYVRTAIVIIIVCGMVILWAFPVAFTGLLSQINYISNQVSWLHWLASAPQWLQSTLQGILPPLLLQILMLLLPVTLRLLSKKQGLQTGMAVELAVQRFYFAFLFLQLFLVVTISASITTTFKQISNVTNIPNFLATNIPKASNYFFSYLILQALSVSAGALLQVFGLISWFILAPVLDNTARKKWARTTNLNQLQWGTFFPAYTTFASIGLIYSIIAPLIMVFNIITFSLFWFVYRYNTLYVVKFRFDTGGLLFPKAINQLFTGIYFMEIALIGLFFLVRDNHGNTACFPQAIIMIVVTVLTVIYQVLLNEAFAPLFRYLPITLEDDAVIRDEEFARVQLRRREHADEQEPEEERRSSRSVQEELEEREKREREADKRAEEIEMERIENDRRERKLHHKLAPHSVQAKISDHLRPSSWADRNHKSNRRSSHFNSSHSDFPTIQRLQNMPETQDPEAQAPPPTKASAAVSKALFAGIHDELEDLTPEERDQLVQRAFTHEALRVKRPVIWIPRDDLGVSDDEIYRTQMLSKHIWISNEYQGLDGKARAIFSRSPPDFSEVDVIQL